MKLHCCLQTLHQQIKANSCALLIRLTQAVQLLHQCCCCQDGVWTADIFECFLTYLSPLSIIQILTALNHSQMVSINSSRLCFEIQAVDNDTRSLRCTVVVFVYVEYGVCRYTSCFSRIAKVCMSNICNNEQRSMRVRQCLRIAAAHVCSSDGAGDVAALTCCEMLTLRECCWYVCAGKTRLSKYYSAFEHEEKRQLEQEVHHIHTYRTHTTTSKHTHHRIHTPHTRAKHTYKHTQTHAYTSTYNTHIHSHTVTTLLLYRCIVSS